MCSHNHSGEVHGVNCFAHLPMVAIPPKAMIFIAFAIFMVSELWPGLREIVPPLATALVPCARVEKGWAKVPSWGEFVL